MIKFDNSKYFPILINIVLVVAVGLGLVWGKYLWKQSKSFQPARTITITAEGKVAVVPDIARISFSVVSEGVNPAALQEDNTKKINAAINFVKEQGVTPADIKTTQYSLSPRYEYDEKRHRSFISGYELRQSVEIKIRDFSKISTILGVLADLGVNEIGQLTFDVDDSDQYLNKAREEAFTKAKVKAKAMSEYSGVRLGRVVTFSESGAFPTPIFYREAALGIGGDFSKAEPIIEPGSQELRLNVAVTYEIR